MSSRDANEMKGTSSTLVSEPRPPGHRLAPTPLGTARVARRGPRSSRRLGATRTPLLMVIPFVVLFIAFILIPLIYSINNKLHLLRNGPVQRIGELPLSIWAWRILVRYTTGYLLWGSPGDYYGLPRTCACAVSRRPLLPG